MATSPLMTIHVCVYVYWVQGRRRVEQMGTLALIYVSVRLTWSVQLPTMSTSCRTKWLGITFSIGGVLFARNRCDTVIGMLFMSTTLTMLSAYRVEVSESEKVRESERISIIDCPPHFWVDISICAKRVVHKQTSMNARISFNTSDHSS